ncbi:Histone acetyltransferase [Clydaea vesicula]|uniref:histone acetyltransferase n=1 Tax=Clydaea vesicula TaxID=447962 RepID=A0AAD5TZT1_9FUNG|nr:Histone acetyltransferase [Clydaea vesicula]
MTPKEIAVGCKCPVEKEAGTFLLAEILSIRKTDTKTEYYVHYDQYNKRLDEWVDHSKLDLKKLEYPKKKQLVLETKEEAKVVPTSKKSNKSNKSKKKLSGKNKKEKVLLAVNDDTESMDLDDGVSGSMTQSHAEIARVKNIKVISMGKFEVETWYFSPYPEEFCKNDILFICEFCLEAVGTKFQFERHRKKCQLFHPPGMEIYRKNNFSFYELDGRKQRRYTRNLCLLSKLFLDHKTLYYDVDPFLFYVMTQNDKNGHHIIGYFSKEKLSAEEYNVACILTLPQYQRKGFGKLLISFSYLLSKHEKKAGSPEKPLSDLGLLSYRSYWADVILELLYNRTRSEVSISEISEETSIKEDDIYSTLTNLDLLKYYQGKTIICLSNKNIEYHEKNLKKKKIKLDPDSLEWTPPKFLSSQLRYL